MLSEEEKQWMAEQFGRMDSRFDKMDARLDGIGARFDGMDARFDKMDARLDGMDARFDKMDARLDGMDARFERIESRLDGMDARLDRMDTRFNGIDARFDKVDARFDRIDNYLLQFREEVTKKFDALEQRVQFTSQIIANLDGRFPILTNAVSGFGEILQTSTNDNWDLAGRVARLEDQVSKLLKPAA